MGGDPRAPRDGGGDRRWDSRSVGSPLQHRIFYFLIRFFGRRAAYALLYPVVGYYMLFRPGERKKSEYYLSRRFPGRNFLQRMADSYRLTLNLGKVLVDRAIVGILGEDEIEIRFDEKQQVLDLAAEGRGLIFMTAHVGCWQLSMSALALASIPVNIVMRREDGDVDRLTYEHRGVPCPYRIVDPGDYLGGTLEMLSALRRGESLTVMGDRILGSARNVVELDFLGGKVRFPYSFFKLASVTGAPIVVAFSRKAADGGYEFFLDRIIEVPEGAGKEDRTFRRYVTLFVEALEKFVDENPWQFFNFYDMWEKDPAGGDEALRAGGVTFQGGMTR